MKRPSFSPLRESGQPFSFMENVHSVKFSSSTRKKSRRPFQRRDFIVLFVPKAYSPSTAFAAFSPATRPEPIAQEFIMAVIESVPFAPPTTLPAP